MSTRGWYEYYVVDDARREVSLAMQFCKWGDAVSENAVAELAEMRRLTHLIGEIPVHLVQSLLQHNVGGALDCLPRSFPLGCYYFFIQRAAEALSPFSTLRFSGLPKEKRPDYQLGFAVGRAEALYGFEVPRYENRVIDMAHFFVSTGMLCRRWQECSSLMTFLD